ncbi:MAG TPA: class I SAM-dependent methyltransferase [Thermomicrobiales bacterium]|nr:class I SAM-dependent methyltransferase [Thermomicrobiales bacterium]
MTEPPFRCPVCGSGDYTPHLELTDRMFATSDAVFPLVRCAGCGLLRLHPHPDAATLAAAYGPGYAPHARSGLSGKAKSWLERRSVRQLRRYLAAPRRVLDVGCATGELLLAIRAAGNPRVTGVETGELAARIARRRGLDVRTGELDDARFPDASFDTVILSHTLEHVPDPASVVAEVARVLRPGGALILWLPNVESLEAALLGRYWIGYDAPRHLTTFGVSTLTRALSGAGLNVAEIRHEAVGLEWAWALRLLARDHLPAAEPILRRLHPLRFVAATPLATLGAALGRSGRVRVIAVKAAA